MSEIVIVSAVRTPIGKYDLYLFCCDVYTGPRGGDLTKIHQ